MAIVVSDNDSSTGLSDASPIQLATALAWKSAAFGARQGGRAVKRFPGVANRVRKQMPQGPIGRAYAHLAENDFSIWSTDSKFSIASIRSHASAWSIYSMLSGGSVASIGSIGSAMSVGSAGSILSIGSAGSILSIGSAGSILAIGGVNKHPWNRGSGDQDDEANPTLKIIEHGGTVVGLAVLASAARSVLSAS